jgi:transposase
MHRKKGTKNTPPEIIEEIITRHAQGITIRELAKEYGKPYKTIGNMITRENNKLRRSEAGLAPKQRGRKAAVTLKEYKYENNRLKMENELLRDFLRLAGRRCGHK